MPYFDDIIIARTYSIIAIIPTCVVLPHLPANSLLVPRFTKVQRSIFSYVSNLRTYEDTKEDNTMNGVWLLSDEVNLRRQVYFGGCWLFLKTMMIFCFVL